MYAVALSGGVDSAVAAYLLKQSSENVFAIFMRNWHETNGACSSNKDLSMATTIANQLELELHVVDFSEQYQKEVFQDFVSDYKLGLTPNPDVLCNKNIKFKYLLNEACRLGADKLATGHYARIDHHNGYYKLLEGLDLSKDQSYFLCALDQHQLSKACFPLGELNKFNVRQIAKELGLANHNRKDSTGICFIEPKHFQEFLKNYILSKPGNIIDNQGHVLGEHTGLSFYTIGQRQGLGIGGLKNSNGEPWYVAQKNMLENTLIVCQGKNNPMLYTRQMEISKPNFNYEGELFVRIRHLGQKYSCKINNCTVNFAEPVRAVTPGQYAAFYQGQHCLGYARILS